MRKFVFFLLVLCLPVFISTTGTAQTKKDWPTKGATIGAAPIGGVYYVWAGGPAKVLGEKLGIPASVESTGGPVHNVQLVNAKELHFGMVTAAPAYEGWNGTGWAKGKKYQNIRAIFPMYTTYFQMYVMKKSGIKSIKDFNGKSIGTGPVGGTPATYWPMIIAEAGVKPKRIVNASSSDLDNQMKDGLLDASGQAVGLPWGLISATETTHEIVVLGVEDDIATSFIKKHPDFAKGVIPKGTYKSLQSDLPTLTVWNFMVTYKDMPDDFIYAFTKEIFKNKPLLVSVHKSAQEVEPKNILYCPIPLHPGAIKYYEEVGIKIPKEMRP
ncbi:MAG: TAXI family TRAP transporter solute-binding subunit [Syntrophorhabdus sp.]|nr:MAG: NMT1/THI5 like protein [Deltaproteobacteria bacterium ADurb.Bin135]HOH27806.1 TAXI family TRAP transporter solute-binding subunit [Syntrophorhabdus sp.]HPW37461.1 TAXI family TRAP transporter solute-binding subunit [Syntrophorhabdus sp.]